MAAGRCPADAPERSLDEAVTMAERAQAERAPARAPPRSAPSEAEARGRAAPGSARLAQLAAVLAGRPRGPEPVQRAAPPNRTGLPDRLKAGVESLSGLAMDDVRVHYNSARPAAIQALAYAQGSEIHLAPGQERHLPHEAWHVAQQKQGRVRPTRQLKGAVPVNDEAGLEREAETMGALAARGGSAAAGSAEPAQAVAAPVVQRLVGFEFETQWDLKAAVAMPAWNTDTVLVRGNGWQISPDELHGDQGKIEFKTAPFDVDGDDREALARPIEAAFAGMTKYIDANLAGLPADRYSPLATTIASARGTTVQPNGELAAKPQVTGGVRTDLVLAFLRDLASEEKAPDLMPGAGRKDRLKASLDYVGDKVDEDSKSEREFGGVIALLAYYVRRFQGDAEEYERERLELRQRYLDQYATYRDEAARSEEQLAAKRQEIDAAYREERDRLRTSYTPSYAKARASALPRIAFNDLPHVRTPVLLRRVLLAAGLAATDGGKRMFPLGFKSDPDFAKTIAEWIGEIQADRGAGEGKLWSARSLGTGPVGSGDKRDTGIPFELRALQGPLPYGEWRNFAAPFLTYFRALNRRAKPPNA